MLSILHDRQAIRNFSFKGASVYHPVQCKVTSSPIFRMGLPASTVTSGTSTGMNSLRSGGTLISMLSHSTLWTQARMELHVIRPSSILSAGEHCNISREQKKGFTFNPSISEGGISRSISLNSMTVLEIFHHFNIIITVTCIGVAVLPVEYSSYVILFLHIQSGPAHAS